MKIREGNAVKQTFTVLRNDVAENFSDATQIKMYANLPNSGKFEIPFSRVDNVFYTAIPASLLRIGTYDVIITYVRPDASFAGGLAARAIDYRKAFQIVPYTEEESYDGSSLSIDIRSGEDGATFIPVITPVSGGVEISWTNDRGLPNPEPVIIGVEFRKEGDVFQYRVIGGDLWYELYDLTPLEDARKDAEDAATLANEKAGLADEAATYALEQGDYAKGQGDYALEQGNYAKEQGNYAKEQGDLAKNIIENIPEIPQATLYINTANTLSYDPPTTPVVIPVNLVGTTPTEVVLPYIATEDSFVSFRSSYVHNLYISGLTTNRQYTIIGVWRIGTTIITQSEKIFTPAGANDLIQIPFPNNELNTNLSYTVGQVFTLTLSIASSAPPNHTINILSNSLQLSTFVRNGGEIGSGQIVDYNGTNTLTQAQRNREYEAGISTATNIYNVTVSVPLGSGFYTSTTARAAVPTSVRKRGLILTYETSSGIWYTERFIGTNTANWTTAGNWIVLNDYDATEKAAVANSVRKTGNETIAGIKTFSSSPIVPAPTTDLQPATKKYVDDADALKQNTLVITADTTPVNTDEILSLRGTSWLKTTWTNVKAFLKTYFDTLYVLITDLATVLPSLRYFLRVTADGGTIVDRGLLAKFYTEFNQSLANTHCLYFPQIGIKERTVGINKYANKLYDLSGNNNDAVQATEATQPFVGGYIAPNEFRCLKYLQGQTQTGEVTIPTKSYLATDSWTLFLVLKANKRGTTRILTGANSYIDITATTIVLHNGTSATLTGTHTYDVGKIAQIEFQYSNGTGLIKVNNVPLATTVISTTMSITRLAYSSTNPFDGSIYYYHLENVRISEAESQRRYTFLRSLIPEIEGIAIGNQFWQTSNVEQTVAGNGTAIPEVQGATTSATERLVGDGTFESGLIGTLQNEVGGATATYTLNTENPISGTQDGRLIVTSAGTILAFRPRIVFIKNLSPNPYITTFNYKVNSGVCVFSGISNGVNYIGGGTLTGTGTFSIYNIHNDASVFLAFDGRNTFDVQIDNISIKEAGWSDLTTPARCYYGNSITNGAVYNKLFNGYAVSLLKNYPPSGYRVATYADWLQLSTFAGGNTISGKKIKKDGLLYWLTTNSGTNELGLSVIGLGKRNVDGTFANIGTEANFWTSDGYLVTIANNADTISFASGADLKTGAGVLLIRTSPTVPQRGVIRVSTTANIASTPLAIPIPFGCQVESIRIRNKQASTNLTSVSATHNNTGGTSLGTLITGKTVNAGVSTIFVATQLDMVSQETDGTIRILATGNGGDGMDVEIIYNTKAL